MRKKKQNYKIPSVLIFITLLFINFNLFVLIFDEYIFQNDKSD